MDPWRITEIVNHCQAAGLTSRVCMHEVDNSAGRVVPIILLFADSGRLLKAHKRARLERWLRGGRTRSTALKDEGPEAAKDKEDEKDLTPAERLECLRQILDYDVQINILYPDAVKSIVALHNGKCRDLSPS